MRPRWMVIAVALALGACAGQPAPRAGSLLTGSAWKLMAIQSMDDAQATTRIPEPGRYTLRLDPGGRASLRLDCNRASTTWEATPASDSTGTLRFGPIASTRALCPPPHLDERIARDLAYVRGYRLIDGKLFMSLMADGGIYEWWPHDE